MKLIQKYFPEVSDDKLRLFEAAGNLYREWNEKINVISRKDMEFIEERHFLHSLSIAKVFDFRAGTEILDFGTGGGFPGIPLALFFPEVKFTLIDSIGKKMTVVKAISETLNLKNVSVEVGRVEDLRKKFDFVTCRAVGRLSKIYPWVRNTLKSDQQNSKPNGYIFLKGGDLKEELSEISLPYERIYLSNFFEESFFETKEIIYLSKQLKINKHD